jgi:hypothetical protein
MQVNRKKVLNFCMHILEGALTLSAVVVKVFVANIN